MKPIFAHGLVPRVLVRADVHFRLRVHHGDPLQLLEEGLRIAHVLEVPEDVAVLVHRDHDVFRLGLRGQVALLGKVERNLLHDDRDRDEEDDEQHQHHVDERRGVDGGHHLFFAFGALSDRDCHGGITSRG
jgi:hypothetical protein